MRLSLPAAAAASAALLMTPASPASAETSALVLICQFQYFGGSSLSGDCTATGIPASGGAHVEASINASFALCPVTRTASGRLDGWGGLAGFSVYLNWTRVSGAGVMTFSGSTTAVGTTVSTDPCAAMLTSETVVMTIVGV